MSHSPWGAIQHSTPLLRGVRVVSTAGHGGMMISPAAAKNYLSKEAISVGTQHGIYLCYEEDAMISVPILDSEEILDATHKHLYSNGPDKPSREKIKMSCLDSVSKLCPVYFIKRFADDNEINKTDHFKRAQELASNIKPKNAVSTFYLDPLIGDDNMIAVTGDDDKFIVKKADVDKDAVINSKIPYFKKDFTVVDESMLPSLVDCYLDYLKKETASIRDLQEQGEDKQAQYKLGQLSYTTEIFCIRLVGKDKILSTFKMVSEGEAVEAIQNKIKSELGDTLNVIADIYAELAYSDEEVLAPWHIRDSLKEAHMASLESSHYEDPDNITFQC